MIISSKFYVVIFILFFVRGESFCQASGYQKVEKISLIKDKQDSSLQNTVEDFFSKLKSKEYGSVYDYIPQAFKKDIAKDDFLKAFSRSTLDKMFSSVSWPDIYDFSINQIQYIDDKEAEAEVKMSVFYKDIVAGITERFEIWTWAKLDNSWHCTKLYSALMDKAKWILDNSQSGITHEFKKEIIKEAVLDEVYTQIKK